MNTRARPSRRVTVSVMSVPHITSTAVVVMVPSCARCSGTADPVRRQQAVLAHQAPDPPGRGADAGMAQPGPDLPVALAMQARAEDLGADVLEQRGIGAGADRASACRIGPVPQASAAARWR